MRDARELDDAEMDAWMDSRVTRERHDYPSTRATWTDGRSIDLEESIKKRM